MCIRDSYVTEQCAARFACTVVNEVDLGTHILFVARVDDWACLLYTSQ